MIFWLMPAIAVLFWIGVDAIAMFQSTQMMPDSIQTTSISMAQNFISYRNAIGSYMSANPSFTGTVPSTAISSYMTTGQSLPAGASNEVVSTGVGTGRIIYTWAQVNNKGEVYQAVQMLDGDASIGIVSGTQWISPVYGTQSLSIPAFVPNGDILSVVEIGS